METGDLSEWYFPSTGPFGNNGGGEEDSGIASASASREVAHSGSYSAKLTITTPNSPTSGTRLFRWLEPRLYSQLYYSVWYYFPQSYTVSLFWNVMQWKSQHPSGNDPFFILNVGNRTDGTMTFYLFNQNRQVTYNQSLKSIPVGQWFQVEAFYQCAGDNTGHVTFWQDGTQIFDVAGVPTRYTDGDCQWSVNNYSSGLVPSTSSIYIDDAVISTARAAATLGLSSNSSSVHALRENASDLVSPVPGRRVHRPSSGYQAERPAPARPAGMIS
ncbi:MAG TPA: heparin lyase I family protein [Candidatus Acidoferrales bacterium]|nr:heparin lyase I family protein [Candidatus Acidoferrales bacterium]